MRRLVAAALGLGLAATALATQSPAAAPGDGCGEVITIATHRRTTTRYALAYPRGAAGPGEPMALVLLVGGGY